MRRAAECGRGNRQNEERPPGIRTKPASELRRGTTLSPIYHRTKRQPQAYRVRPLIALEPIDQAGDIAYPLTWAAVLVAYGSVAVIFLVAAAQWVR